MTEPLRVLRLLSHLGTGGTERQALEVAAHMHAHREELGADIELATFCGPPFEHVLPPPPGVAWHRIEHAWTIPGALRSARALAELATGFDCIHAMLWPAIWVAALSRTSVPIVASIHSSTLKPGPLGLKRRLDRRFLRKAARVVFNSEAGRDRLATKLGSAPDRVAVIPNGKIPLERSPRDRSGIVCVSRVVPGKRQELLLDGLGSLPNPVPGGLTFVGRGTDEGPLGERIRALGRPDVRGIGEVPDAIPHVGAARILALPTDHEGMPNVILEAWNTRTAVVASRAPGVQQLVRDGVDGVLVNNTPDDWGRTLAALLDDPARCEALATAGRDRLEREFSLAAAGRRWADVYAAAVRTA